MSFKEKYYYSCPDRVGKYIKYPKEIFGSDLIEEIYPKLPQSEQEKLLKISFFYYFRGWELMKDPDWHMKNREDLIFIPLVSIVECIMSDREHEHFIDWFPKNGGKFDSFNEAVDSYRKEFGLSKKFKSFLSTYLSENDRYKLLVSLEKWDDKNKKFNQVSENVDEFSNFLYDLRSKFVHDARYIAFFNERADISVASYRDVMYIFKLKFSEVVRIFEGGIMNYFLSKTG